MNVIRKDGKWRLFDRTTGLILMDEKTLDRIVENPSQPLAEEQEKGFSVEKFRLYEKDTSLVDICRKGKENGAERLELSYDFFFGGSNRVNYPDSETTIKSYKVIHDVAAEYGLKFSASIVSPLDVGGGYARKFSNTGFTCQFKEGLINSQGEYQVEIDLQTQWTNNKGPIQLKLEKILVYAFEEERIQDTALYAVNSKEILDISDTAQHAIDEKSIEITFNGYGHGRMTVWGKTEAGKNRCLVIPVYRTPELDYFDEHALDYMKSVIDLHHDNGIRYDGFYSDEMHIQFDWDLFNHFGHDSEINTRYLTPKLAEEYARRYGDQYLDFARYLIYFAYHQHDFLEGEEGKLPSQHVFGKNEEAVYETWLFRKRYFEMIQRRVVDLALETKKHAESLFGAPIMTKAHSTWQEAPTCDRFYEEARFSEFQDARYSRYDYTPEYVWSSSIRENIAACYDYFKWNEYLTGGGTDHPEGGFLDRNYYGNAFACSLAALNRNPMSYYGSWGSPKPVLTALRNVGVTYGNASWGRDYEHNLVQGLSPRLTDVLTLYPLDLNYVEERFGSWMVQYGYTNYITEDEILKHFKGIKSGKLQVRDDSYRALVVFYSPFIKKETLDIIEEFVKGGGKVLWSSVYPLNAASSDKLLSRWKELFGIQEYSSAHLGKTAKGRQISFHGTFSDVRDMTILTDMLPDQVYPVVPAEGTQVAAMLDGEVVGTFKAYPGNGAAVYLGFRPRDDQSCSTGEDVDTLFRVLELLGAYEEGSCEVLSRRTESRYIINRFKNGAVSIANHIRTFREGWEGKFFRDEEEDAQCLEGRELPETRVELEQFSLNGNCIGYSGEGFVTYRLNSEGVLTGFEGMSTTGITLNGREYRFSPQPGDITWCLLDRADLAEGIETAYAVITNLTGEIRLPIPEAAGGYRAALCEDGLFQAQQELACKSCEEGISLNLTENEKEKWIVIYK